MEYTKLHAYVPDLRKKSSSDLAPNSPAGSYEESPRSEHPPILTATSAGAPAISINGNNPALINVNGSHADLGATITAPKPTRIWASARSSTASQQRQ
jgi:hypothetical protein